MDEVKEIRTVLIETLHGMFNIVKDHITDLDNLLICGNNVKLIASLVGNIEDDQFIDTYLDHHKSMMKFILGGENQPENSIPGVPTLEDVIHETIHFNDEPQDPVIVPPPKKSKRITNEQQKQILEIYSQYTIADLAKMFDVSRQQIYRTVFAARQAIQNRIEVAESTGDTETVEKMKRVLTEKLPHKGVGPVSGIKTGINFD